MIQIKPANASAWAKRVRPIFFSIRSEKFGFRHGVPVLSGRGPADRSADQASGGGNERGGQRVGEGQQQGDGDGDDERGVEQAGGDEHTELQDRNQYRLAGGRFQELAGHQGQAETGAEGGQTDHDADGQGGAGLDLGELNEGFHGYLQIEIKNGGKEKWNGKSVAV